MIVYHVFFRLYHMFRVRREERLQLMARPRPPRLPNQLDSRGLLRGQHCPLEEQQGRRQS
jgi:hypothetical protein